MFRWFLVVFYLIGALVCTVESIHLLSWDTVAAHVTKAEVYRCGEVNADLCSRVAYDYDVDGVTYHQSALRPFFDTANDATFWRAYRAANAGIAIAGYVAPNDRYQSALNRFPGPISVAVLYGLFGVTVVCLTGRRMGKKLGPSLRALRASKGGRFAGKAGKFWLVKFCIFGIGTFALMLLPAAEGQLYPWTHERMQVVSMTPTGGPKDHCMDVVVAPAGKGAQDRPGRAFKSCNSGRLFPLLASLQLHEPLDLHVRKTGDQDDIRLAPHITSGNVRWATWYGLLLILLI